MTTQVAPQISSSNSTWSNLSHARRIFRFWNQLDESFAAILVSILIAMVPLRISNAALEMDQSIQIDPTGQLRRLTEAQLLWEDAYSAWENDDILSATESITRAIELSPNDADLLNFRADILLEEGRYREAIEDLETAAGLLPGSDSAHGNLGWALILEGSFLKSRRASLAASKLDPLTWQWQFNLAHSYLLLGDVVTARKYYEIALPLIPSLSELESPPWADFEIFMDRGWSVGAVTETAEWLKSNYSDYSEHRSAISLLYSTIEYQSNHQYQLALETSMRALAQLNQLFEHDHLIMAWANYFVASSYHSLGNYNKAEEYYVKALAIPSRVLGEDSPYTADFLRDLGMLYWSMGEYARAEANLKTSLSIIEGTLGADHYQTGTGLNNLGRLYVEMGSYLRAESLLLKSLALSERNYGPNSDAVADDLDSLAHLYYSKGDYSVAERLYLRALEIVTGLHGTESNSYATTESNLGLLYQDLGDYDRAERMFEHSLEISEATFGRNDLNTAIAIHNLASLLSDKEEIADAETLYKEGISIAEKVLGPRHPLMSVDYHNLATLYDLVDNTAEAISYFERALLISQQSLGTDHPSTISTILSLADLLHTSGQSERARSLYSLIPPIPAAGRSPEVLAYLQYGWATYFAREEEYEAAVFYGKHAVNTLQEFRGTLTELEKKLQQLFVDKRSSIYRDLANWLIETGRFAEAQQILAMLREDEYFQYIQRSASEDPRKTQAAYSSSESAWAARYQEINKHLVSISIEFQELENLKAAGLTEAQKSRYRTLEADIRVGREAFMVFQEQIRKDYFAQGMERTIELANKDIDIDSLDRISGILASQEVETALLTYLIGENQLRILLTLPSALPIVREVDVSGKDLRHRVYEYRSILNDPYSDPVPAANELYRLLIAPVEADLLQSKTRLLILQLDDVLRYLPFSALHDGDGYLIQRYALSIYTPAVSHEDQNNRAASWRVAGFGFAKGTQEFPALPFAVQELDAIVKERESIDSVGIVEGTVRVDGDFTSLAMSDLLSSQDFSVLHMATHFVFRPGTVNESYLVLGEGKRLSLNELRLGNYPFLGLDLITLSACDTAMGMRNADGREMEGFATLAQRRGAASVIATLWPVADMSTAYLMVRFYDVVTRQGGAKAEALRRAQIDFIELGNDTDEGMLDFKALGLEDIEDDGSVSMKRLSHPYFWAPFILMGDWS
jgi:CHAT domain-containing protein/Tfp pilus assembly protein PilF